MENHHVQWENPLKMVSLNSYVKLPEGTSHASTLLGNIRMSLTPCELAC